MTRDPTNVDWVAWHQEYADPSSRLSRRLGVVQAHVRRALDAMPAGPVRIVSMCAGRGRDVIDVVASHPRRDDVRARLVELHPDLAAEAQAASAALGGMEVVCADASASDVYAGAVPADVVLACGIFGNVSPADVRRTVEFLPRMCAPGAWVVWTRHPGSRKVIDDIHTWFESAGFDSHGFDDGGGRYGVGLHRLVGEALPFEPGKRLFTFGG